MEFWRSRLVEVVAMTESDWWTATDPDDPIDWLFFDAQASEHKCRAFATVCCRRVAHLVRHEELLRLLEAIEEMVAGREDAREVERLAEIAVGCIGRTPSPDPMGCFELLEFSVAARSNVEPR